VDELTDQLKKFRKDAFRIIWQTIESVDAEDAVNKHVKLKYEKLYIEDKLIYLDNFKNIYVIGAGKASAHMAKAIENILIRRIKSGLICVKQGYDVRLNKILVAITDHPIPDENSFLAAKKTYEIVKECEPDDLIICLLSGGASSIWSLPHPPIPFQDKQKCIKILLGCGADNNELSTIRKHISRVKGGQLARAAHPTRIITLAISDVVDDDLSLIGSGPTTADPTTYTNALEVINKYNLSAIIPESIQNHIWNGTLGEIRETPKPGDPLFKNNIECIVTSNQEALKSAQHTANYLGYDAKIITAGISGEARDIGRQLIEKARNISNTKKPESPPVLLLFGGKTIITQKGEGKGGPNQELALAAALEVDNLENVFFASFGTDGSDGFTDAAGAFADCTTVSRGKDIDLNAKEYLNNNNSYEYFSRLGDLIKTGPTSTNVMDIQMVIIY